MAYNSLKRVFGETRLELKLLLLFGVGLLVIIATAFWRYGYNTAKLVYEQNRDTAQLVLQERLRTTHIGAVKIHLIRPGSIAPTPEQVNEERQWIEVQNKQFSIRPGGKVDWIWSHEHPNASAPAMRTKRRSAGSSSPTRPRRPMPTTPSRSNARN